ncbi:MAG TPA: peptide deformylase [Ferrovibrio sp.]|jgi:peptide deformylase|uniref:peptide deformylase n=1 Tax=Ferrovibrio sp. TaxID=1917215 RepID=UPI002B4B703E|nr:peptide deformylase [Ferrovibrio sp.]HLT76148.1 peptide deformylase [Ferrovibrio sp.]
MALLPIITAPDKRLEIVSTPVEAVTDEVRDQLDSMLETMYAAPGIGLAAIQVGIPKRMLVIDISRENEEKQPLFIVNPEITWVSDEDSVYEEGCLSLPEQYADVARPKEVKVRYLDRDGESRELHATGLLATCLQHEMDHLDGILFVDHLSALKRNMILRRLLKQKRLAVAG